MDGFLKKVSCFIEDERAAEISELGIVLAAIVVGAIVVVVAIGPKLVDAYNKVKTEVSP